MSVENLSKRTKALEVRDEDLEYYVNNTFTTQFQIKDSDGNVQNVSGYSGVVTVDQNRAIGSAVVGIASITVASAVAGLITFSPSAAITSSADEYYYNCTLTDTASLDHTVRKGKFFVRHK